MIEKVKGISHVNPVKLGTGGMNDRQNEKNNGNSAFHYLLTQAMKPEAATPVAETYKLDLSRVTHSLFYSGEITLDLLGRF